MIFIVELHGNEHPKLPYLVSKTRVIKSISLQRVATKTDAHASQYHAVIVPHAGVTSMRDVNRPGRTGMQGSLHDLLTAHPDLPPNSIKLHA